MFPIRKELVGKRFAYIRSDGRRNGGRLRCSQDLESRNLEDFIWVTGIIIASNVEEIDRNHHFVLSRKAKLFVEYDSRQNLPREWLKLNPAAYKIFLVEENLVLCRNHNATSRSNCGWPALHMAPILQDDFLDLYPGLVPVEYMGAKKELCFVVFDDIIQSFPNEDQSLLWKSVNQEKYLKNDFQNWERIQKTQMILLYGPYSLTGLKVEMFSVSNGRCYTAVIVSHDCINRLFDVMDDQMLKTRKINPRMIHVNFLASDNEIDKLMCGEAPKAIPTRNSRYGHQSRLEVYELVRLVFNEFVCGTLGRKDVALTELMIQRDEVYQSRSGMTGYERDVRAGQSKLTPFTLPTWMTNNIFVNATHSSNMAVIEQDFPTQSQSNCSQQNQLVSYSDDIRSNKNSLGYSNVSENQMMDPQIALSTHTNASSYQEMPLMPIDTSMPAVSNSLGMPETASPEIARIHPVYQHVSPSNKLSHPVNDPRLGHMCSPVGSPVPLQNTAINDRPGTAPCAGRQPQASPNTGLPFASPKHRLADPFTSPQRQQAAARLDLSSSQQDLRQLYTGSQHSPRSAPNQMSYCGSPVLIERQELRRSHPLSEPPVLRASCEYQRRASLPGRFSALDESFMRSLSPPVLSCLDAPRDISHTAASFGQNMQSLIHHSVSANDRNAFQQTFPGTSDISHVDQLDACFNTHLKMIREAQSKHSLVRNFLNLPLSHIDSFKAMRKMLIKAQNNELPRDEVHKHFNKEMWVYFSKIQSLGENEYRTFLEIYKKEIRKQLNEKHFQTLLSKMEKTSSPHPSFSRSMSSESLFQGQRNFAMSPPVAPAKKQRKTKKPSAVSKTKKTSTVLHSVQKQTEMSAEPTQDKDSVIDSIGDKDTSCNEEPVIENKTFTRPRDILDYLDDMSKLLTDESKTDIENEGEKASTEPSSSRSVENDTHDSQIAVENQVVESETNHELKTEESTTVNDIPAQLAIAMARSQHQIPKELSLHFESCVPSETKWLQNSPSDLSQNLFDSLLETNSISYEREGKIVEDLEPSELPPSPEFLPVRDKDNEPEIVAKDGAEASPTDNIAKLSAEKIVDKPTDIPESICKSSLSSPDVRESAESPKSDSVECSLESKVERSTPLPVSLPAVLTSSVPIPSLCENLDSERAGDDSESTVKPVRNMYGRTLYYTGPNAKKVSSLAHHVRTDKVIDQDIKHRATTSDLDEREMSRSKTSMEITTRLSSETGSVRSSESIHDMRKTSSETAKDSNSERANLTEIVGNKIDSISNKKKKPCKHKRKPCKCELQLNPDNSSSSHTNRLRSPTRHCVELKSKESMSEKYRKDGKSSNIPDTKKYEPFKIIESVQVDNVNEDDLSFRDFVSKLREANSRVAAKDDTKNDVDKEDATMNSEDVTKLGEANSRAIAKDDLREDAKKRVDATNLKDVIKLGEANSLAVAKDDSKKDLDKEFDATNLKEAIVSKELSTTKGTLLTGMETCASPDQKDKHSQLEVAKLDDNLDTTITDADKDKSGCSQKYSCNDEELAFKINAGMDPISSSSTETPFNEDKAKIDTTKSLISPIPSESGGKSFISKSHHEATAEKGLKAEANDALGVIVDDKTLDKTLQTDGDATSPASFPSPRDGSKTTVETAADEIPPLKTPNDESQEDQLKSLEWLSQSTHTHLLRTPIEKRISTRTTEKVQQRLEGLLKNACKHKRKPCKCDKDADKLKRMSARTEINSESQLEINFFKKVSEIVEAGAKTLKKVLESTELNPEISFVGDNRSDVIISPDACAVDNLTASKEMEINELDPVLNLNLEPNEPGLIPESQSHRNMPLLCATACQNNMTGIESEVIFSESSVNEADKVQPTVTGAGKQASVFYDPVKVSLENSDKDSFRNSVKDSVNDSVKDSVEDSVKDSVSDLVKDSAKDSVKDPTKDSVKDSLKGSAKDSGNDSDTTPHGSERDLADKNICKPPVDCLANNISMTLPDRYEEIKQHTAENSSDTRLNYSSLHARMQEMEEVDPRAFKLKEKDHVMASKNRYSLPLESKKESTKNPTERNWPV